MIIDKITESMMDRIMDTTNQWSRIMAWSAVAGAVLLIIIPALATIWAR